MKSYLKRNSWLTVVFSCLTILVFIGVYSCKKNEPTPEPEVKKYNVTLVRNNGQADTILVVNEGSKLPTLKTPVKATAASGDEFKFSGWYTNTALTGDPFDVTTSRINSNQSLYAKYSISFKVTVNTLKKNGSADSTIVLKIAQGETIPLLTLPIPRKDKEDKFFKGWFDAQTGGSEYTDATAITKSLNIYYQMETTIYKTFDIDGTNRTLTIGGYTDASPDKITTVVNFAPPAKIGVFKVKQIGRDMFYPVDNGSSNNTLKTITIPEGVQEIIGGVFRNCAAVTSITLPSTLKKLDGAVFWGNGVKNLVIPDGPTYIPMNFAVGSKIETITLPKTITEMQDAAFAHCDNLKSVKVPDNVKWIGMNCFGSCDALEAISWNVETSKFDSIAGGAFFDCVKLSNITFPNSLRVIGAKADSQRNMFINCISLATVTIPANVKRLGGGAFALCDKLTEVIFLGNTPPWMDDAVFNKREGTPWVTIKVPAAALQAYLDACNPPYKYGEDWKWWNTCCGKIIAK